MRAKTLRIFPDSKTQIVRYCNLQVNLSLLFTELVKSKIQNTIILCCYKELLDEVGEENTGNML